MLTYAKDPAYDSALVGEARVSAGKIEGGFWTKSSSAADYESRARKMLESVSAPATSSEAARTGETQRAHYEAAMAAQVALLQASAAPAAPPSAGQRQLAGDAGSVRPEAARAGGLAAAGFAGVVRAAKTHPRTPR